MGKNLVPLQNRCPKRGIEIKELAGTDDTDIVCTTCGWERHMVDGNVSYAAKDGRRLADGITLAELVVENHNWDRMVWPDQGEK